MPSHPSLLAGAAFLVAGGLSAVAAQTVVRTLEERSVEAVATELRTQGYEWASVLGDGLQVVLEGEAPSEVARFEAISAAASVVDGARVIDNLRVAEAEAIAPPDFAIEILRNDAGVSLIGLVPAATAREDLTDDFAEAAPGQEIADLLQTADYPVPEGWEPALDYALDALELLPRAKISVAAGEVYIDAISDSPEEQRRLETELTRRVPEGVRLALSVSAPRPVITPFTVRATLEDGRLSFDACSADSEEALDAIRSAAVAAGAEGQLDCRLGLGSPSPDWGRAVAQGLAALHELGGGTLTFSDADVALVALPTSDASEFDRIAAELDGALPAVFALDAQRPAPVAAETPQGPPEFTASLSGEGAVRLGGRIEDRRMGELARAFAQARFGADDVALAVRPGAQGLPSDWTMRVLTGIEALSRLHDGTVAVTPDLLTVSGRTGHRAARDEIAARAIETLGPDAALRISVTYDEELDPLAALPSPEECLAKISSVTDAAKITFDPGSATISSDGEPVIEAIAEILRSCSDLRLRIAGYTDSQGREESNLRLSQERAEAVLSALRAERVPVLGFEAQGYGEASPIASNETEAGREANRRIEFTLLGAATSVSTPVAGASEDPAGGAANAGEEPVPSEPVMEQPDAPPLRPEEVEDRAALEQNSEDEGAAVGTEQAVDTSAEEQPGSTGEVGEDAPAPTVDRLTGTATVSSDAEEPVGTASAIRRAEPRRPVQGPMPAVAEGPPAAPGLIAAVPSEREEIGERSATEAEAVDVAEPSGLVGPLLEQPDTPPLRPQDVVDRAEEEASRIDPEEALDQIGQPDQVAQEGTPAASEVEDQAGEDARATPELSSEGAVREGNAPVRRSSPGPVSGAGAEGLAPGPATSEEPAAEAGAGDPATTLPLLGIGAGTAPEAEPAAR